MIEIQSSAVSGFKLMLNVQVKRFQAQVWKSRIQDKLFNKSDLTAQVKVEGNAQGD